MIAIVLIALRTESTSESVVNSQKVKTEQKEDCPEDEVPNPEAVLHQVIEDLKRLLQEKRGSEELVMREHDRLRVNSCSHRCAGRRGAVRSYWS